jgi:hypothetical protein
MRMLVQAKRGTQMYNSGSQLHLGQQTTSGLYG